MKLIRTAAVSFAAAALAPAASWAADLPTRKAAPVQYVKICDAYGAGFFYIPGTDTCLRVGGLVLAQTRIQGSSQMYSMAPQSPGASLSGFTAVLPSGAVSAATGVRLPLTYGYVPSTSGFSNPNGYKRDQMGFDAQGRVELDARTQSPWGTVRTFLRMQAVYGTGVNATTGSYGSILQSTSPVAGLSGPIATTAKDYTYLDKAFIQFAGITAGRAQSMFDFYNDAFNFETIRGSNQNVWELAYTATFGGGLSATLAMEDPQSHRGIVTSVTNIAGYPGLSPLGPLAGTALGATTTATRLPEFVANLRLDQSWGSAQLMGALHPVRAAVYNAFMGATWPFAQSDKLGFAVGGGVKVNLDMLAPGDSLWLQAIYAKGAIGYTSGSSMSYSGSPNLTQNYGVGLNRMSNNYGWGNLSDSDCVFTFSGQCELSSSLAITAALNHFWTPSLRSAVFGSYYQVRYSGAAVNPVGYSGAFFGGVTNYTELRAGANLIWSPIKNLDIGGELTWIRGIQNRPQGLAPDYALNAAGLPNWRSTEDAFYGKLRMLRAF